MKDFQTKVSLTTSVPVKEISDDESRSQGAQATTFNCKILFHFLFRHSANHAHTKKTGTWKESHTSAINISPPKKVLTCIGSTTLGVELRRTVEVKHPAKSFTLQSNKQEQSLLRSEHTRHGRQSWEVGCGSILSKLHCLCACVQCVRVCA